MHIDQKYIQYLIDHDQAGIQTIYKLFAKKVVQMIQYNSGSEDDAFDIFQESLMDIYHMSKNKNFTLTTSFQSFLMMVCKRKWLNELKKRQRREVTNVDDYVFDIEDGGEEELREHLLLVEKENLVMHLLTKLGDRCQEIIKHCMTGQNQELVAETLGLSYAYLRKKKSECMSKLGELVKDHPFFKNIGNEN